MILSPAALSAQPFSQIEGILDTSTLTAP